jgi:hypothetical protein
VTFNHIPLRIVEILLLPMSAKIIPTGLLILLTSFNQFQKKPAMEEKIIYKEGFIKTNRVR